MIDWLLAYPMWPKYVGLAVVLAAFSAGPYRKSLLTILLALLLAQAFKPLQIGDAMWVAFAFVWIVAAGAIWRHSATTSILTLISATCYAWGRIGGFPFAAGTPMWASPLFWADMALIAAILFAGARGVQLFGISFGRRDLGGSIGGRRSYPGIDLAAKTVARKTRQMKESADVQ